jgi:hypothetical protein
MKIHGVKYGKPFIEINEKVTKLIVLPPVLLMFVILIWASILKSSLLFMLWILSCVPVILIFLFSPNYS